MKYKIKTIYLKLIPSLFIAICLLSFNENLQAQPGTIDSSFGINGKAMLEGFGFGFVKATALQNDGKIIVVGELIEPPTIVISRLNSDGSRDGNFGDNGIVNTDLFPTHQFYASEAYDVTVQSDGKILVAGSGYHETIYSEWLYDALILRYNPDGSLDEDFGDHGAVISDFEGDDDAAHKIVLQTDGKIIIGGTSIPDLFVARYQTDGSIDDSFGGGQGWIKDGRAGVNLFTGLALQQDGKIAIAGNMSYEGFIIRYQANGLRDPGFGTDGMVKTDADSNDEINDILLQQDGKIIAGGVSYKYYNNLRVALLLRYDTGGGSDESFGQSGRVYIAVDSGDIAIGKLSLQNDQQIMGAGSFVASNNRSHTATLFKFNKDGSQNLKFDNDGILFGIGKSDIDLVLQADDKILTLGADSFFDSAFLVRYNGEKETFPKIAKIKKWLHHHGVTWEDKPDNKINYYSVERSVNGAGFNEIARISHSSNTASYQFEDPAPLSGDNYYRLSAVSADGSSVTSNIVLVENNTAVAATIKIYPNPAKNNLIIEGLASTGNTKLRITDLYGNNVFKATATGNTHTFIIAALKAGTYIITIETGNETVTKKFVKE